MANAKQPNFEKIKTAIYQLAQQEANMHVLMEGLSFTGLPHSFRERKKEFLDEMNKWLDGIDIRCAGQMIDVVVEAGGKLPSWMVKKKFIIDYNEHTFLDLHRV